VQTSLISAISCSEVLVNQIAWDSDVCMRPVVLIANVIVLVAGICLTMFFGLPSCAQVFLAAKDDYLDLGLLPS